MEYFSVECEAPGPFGPEAILRYDDAGRYIQDVDYLDIEFQVWLGGDLVSKTAWYGISQPLWEHISDRVKGVSIRKMTVTPGEQVNDRHPGRKIPQFLELVVSRSVEGREDRDGCVIVRTTIPDADVFTGLGLPLIVSGHAKELLRSYGIPESDFKKVRVI